MTNKTLISTTCNKCGKESKVTRKEGWKYLIIQRGMCPDCAKKNPLTKKNIWKKWTTEREEKDKGFWKTGISMSNIPIVDLLLQIVVCYVLWKLLFDMNILGVW